MVFKEFESVLASHGVCYMTTKERKSDTRVWAFLPAIEGMKMGMNIPRVRGNGLMNLI